MTLLSVLALSSLLNAEPPAPAAPAAAAPVWKQEKGRDGLHIETRQMKTGFDEIRVTAQVARAPDTACAVLWDVDNHVEPGMKKRQVITTKGNDRWTYERVAAPFNDRDYTLHRRKQPVGEGCHIVFETQNDKGPPPTKGVIRIPVIRGEWLVEKGAGAEDGASAAKVVYTVYAEPGGVAPVFARGPEFDRSVQYAKMMVKRINTAAGAEASAQP